LFVQRRLKHTGVPNGDHCIVQFRSVSCCSLSVDSRALLKFSRIMSTIVHLLRPVSSSHSHILTVSRHPVKKKMLQVQKTLNYQQFSREFRYSSIDYWVIMMQTHKACAR